MIRRQIPQPSAFTTNVRKLVETIFDGVLADIELQGARLSRENAERQSGARDGFFYKTDVYSHLDVRARKGAQFGSCHPSLYEQADALHDRKKNLHFEKTRTQQALALLLTDAKTMQEVRDALPEFLISYFPEFKGVSRTRPEAWTLEGKPEKQAQYLKLRGLMEYYLVMKLLY